MHINTPPRPTHTNINTLPRLSRDPQHLFSGFLPCSSSSHPEVQPPKPSAPPPSHSLGMFPGFCRDPQGSASVFVGCHCLTLVMSYVRVWGEETRDEQIGLPCLITPKHPPLSVCLDTEAARGEGRRKRRRTVWQRRAPGRGSCPWVAGPDTPSPAPQPQKQADFFMDDSFHIAGILSLRVWGLKHYVSHRGRLGGVAT